MSDKQNVTINGGSIGLPGLLTVLFVALKVTDYVDWSWWWVFSPLWISAGIGVLFLAIGLGLLAVAGLLDRK